MSVALLVIGPPVSAAPSCLRIGIDPGSLGAKAIATLLTTLYARAGLCVDIQEIPNKRIAIMIRTHQLDGEGDRIADYIAASPDLIAIPTPLRQVVGKLYWRKGRARPQGADQTIGYIRGFVWPPLAAQTLKLGITEVADENSLTKMAETGRIDGFFMTDAEFSHLQTVDREEYEGAAVRDLTVFHCITRDHADLVERLNEALSAMKSDGTLDQIIRVQAPPTRER